MRIVPARNDAFVGEVHDVDLRRSLDDADIDAIRQGMDQYAVLVFRDQRLTDAEQEAFSKRFGPLEVAASKSPRMSSRHLSDVSNLDADNQLLQVGSERRAYSLANQLWHTDSSFKPVQATYSLLSARVVTPTGGETEFADMRAAHDALPDKMKARLDGLRAVHSLEHSRATIGFPLPQKMLSTDLPPVTHPVVQVHPGSGRRALFLASHASHIVGWEVPDGRLLLLQLIEFATQRQFVYRHEWRVGDLVMWDNRCTMHRGLPYESTDTRDLRRTTVSSAASAAAAGASAAA